MTREQMSEFVKVAKLSELAPGAARKVDLSGQDVALFNVAGKICAIQDLCPHRGGSLAEGYLEGDTVTCPWHGWRFRVTDGLNPVNPAAKVSCYQVKVEGDDVYVSA